jgi:hypothetical protein
LFIVNISHSLFTLHFTGSTAADFADLKNKKSSFTTLEIVIFCLTVAIGIGAFTWLTIYVWRLLKKIEKEQIRPAAAAGETDSLRANNDNEDGIASRDAGDVSRQSVPLNAEENPKTK